MIPGKRPTRPHGFQVSEYPTIRTLGRQPRTATSMSLIAVVVCPVVNRLY